jgi:hypothetical protein
MNVKSILFIIISVIAINTYAKEPMIHHGSLTISGIRFNTWTGNGDDKDGDTYIKAEIFAGDRIYSSWTQEKNFRFAEGSSWAMSFNPSNPIPLSEFRNPDPSKRPRLVITIISMVGKDFWVYTPIVTGKLSDGKSYTFTGGQVSMSDADRQPKVFWLVSPKK